jgi:HK97 family phage prohead protease
MSETERRIFSADLELRDEGNASGQLRLIGHASRTETPYEVRDFVETIARGAFRSALAANPDVVLLLNHDGLPLARTKSKLIHGRPTLQLSEDDLGLRVDALLDREDPDVRGLAVKMRRGDLEEMSFAFTVPAGGQTWSDDRKRRLISRVDLDRGDVSLVTYGANAASKAQLVARARYLTGRERSPGGVPDLTTRRRERLALLRGSPMRRSA